MILIDTSVWVNHLRQGSDRLSRLLLADEVACHVFVIGELACGHLRRRHEILTLLKALPSVPRAEDEQVLRFIERHDLAGKGLGLVDTHLLAACTLAGVPLWTEDRKLGAAAKRIGAA